MASLLIQDGVYAVQKEWIFNCFARIIKNWIFLQWVCVINARKFPSEDNFRARGSASDPIFAPLFRNCMTYEVSWFSGGFTSLRNFQLAKIYKRRAKWGSSIKNRNYASVWSRTIIKIKLSCQIGQESQFSITTIVIIINESWRTNRLWRWCFIHN